MDNNINALYKLWLENAVKDGDLIEELKSIEGKEDEILDRFYTSLEFGTAGLRGTIGAGTNRMNIYTVGQATQGLADYLNGCFENPSVAIAYDSRIKSELFAKTAAGILAANGVKTYIYDVLVPTPMLSYAVIELKCSSGIIITASHNPSKYNGYKCYDYRGYQMTDESAEKTLGYIREVDVFKDIKWMDFEKGLENGLIEYIPENIKQGFYDAILKCRINPDVYEKSGIKVIYSPLNGTGNIPVRHILNTVGVKDLRVVKAQELPDGNFPTCPFPNPEIRQVFEEGLKMTDEFPADILLATDPDCDRVGIAVRDNGEYKLMTGNEVACMLTNYVLTSRIENGTLPENPIIVKTIVTSPLVRAICDRYGAQMIDLLTGFKYIGEVVDELINKGEGERFLLGMEESYGYLSGTHAKDKDAVNASMLIIEMAAYYKLRGKTLIQVMDDLYTEYGMYLSSLFNFGFEGADGMAKMKSMMEGLRENPPQSFGGLDVLAVSDYRCGERTASDGTKTKINLPSSNVLSYELYDDSKIIVRPSGTEPKIKIYITAHFKTRDEAAAATEKFIADAKKYMGIE